MVMIASRDDEAARVSGDIAHEREIDLHAVDGEAPQVTQFEKPVPKSSIDSVTPVSLSRSINRTL
jgi:hypothetical protein